MKNIIKDERIENLQTKIVSQAYMIALALLFVSIFVKIYMYNNDPKTYFIEMIIIVVSGLYMLVRFIIAGINPLGTNRTNRAITVATLAAAIVAAISLITNWEGHQRLNSIGASIITIGITFAVAFGLTFGSMLLFTKLSKTRARKLEKSFDK